MQDAHPGVLGGHEGYTPKSYSNCRHYASHSLSHKNGKILCLDPSLLCSSFTAEVPSTI